MTKNKERHLHSPMIPFSYNKKVLSLATDVRIYKDAALLQVGTWTDCASRSPVIYTEQALKASATNWKRIILMLTIVMKQEID